MGTGGKTKVPESIYYMINRIYELEQKINNFNVGYSWDDIRIYRELDKESQELILKLSKKLVNKE